MGRRVLKEHGYRVDDFVAFDDDSLEDTTDESSASSEGSYNESDNDESGDVDYHETTQKKRHATIHSPVKVSDSSEQNIDPQLLTTPATPKVGAKITHLGGNAVNEHGLVTPDASPSSTILHNGNGPQSAAKQLSINESEDAVGTKNHIVESHIPAVSKKDLVVQQSIEQNDDNGLASDIGACFGQYKSDSLAKVLLTDTDSDDSPSTHEKDDSYRGSSASPSSLSTSSDFATKVGINHKKRQAISIASPSRSPAIHGGSVAAHIRPDTGITTKLLKKGAKRFKCG